MTTQNLLKIIFVEDLPSDADLAVLELRKEGLRFEHKRVDTRDEFIKALNEFKPDLIISDYMMPSYDGMQALMDAREYEPIIPFILYTGSMNEETAVECIKAGATDYIIKEHMTRLPFAVKEALDQHNIQIEKRAAELLLKENEEKLKSIFSAAPVGIGLLVNQVFMEINDTFCKMTGYNRIELIGKNAEIIYAKNEQNESAGIVIYRHLAENGTGSVETRFKCKDGRILNIFLSSTPLDKDDLTKGITFIAMDITERKRAEEALLESEGKFKAIFQNSNDAIMLLNKDGFFDCNPRTLELFKVNKKEEFIKSHPADLSPPFQPNGKNSFEALQEQISIAYREGYNRFDWIHRRTDGEDFYTEVILSAFDFGGERVLQATVRDIAERKKAEKTLRESEIRYKALFSNAAEGILVAIIETMQFLYANPVICKMFGYTEEEFILLGVKDIHPKESLDYVRAEFETLMLGEKTLVSDLPCQRKDGTLFYADIRSTLIVIDGYECNVGFFIDITERKLEENALKHAKEKAEASDKLKTTFLNNISHEVRTPLNGIMGFAEIITQPDLSEEEKKDSLSMLFESSDRLLNTITSYVDISMITSGNISAHNKDFIPGQVLSIIFDNYKTKCSNRQLELLLRIPEQTENLSVSSDKEIFQKIISHLLDNAIKFTEKGSIEYGYIINKEEFEFFVKDTGIGIGKESLEVVFDYFVKEDRGPLKLFEGSGLGLSISKGFVELLGGKIRVESEKGKGSSFFFTIPKLKENKADITGNQAFKQKPDRLITSILVAEDDKVSFLHLNALLKQNTSAEIIHASDGKEAVEIFMQNPGIGLILMDIKMPVMDGLEATRQIKAINRNIPVVAITAYAMSGDEDRVLAAGCDGYLSKPISKKSLMTKIAEFIKV